MTSATIIDTPADIDRFVIVTIRGAIKLYRDTGMKANRAYTPTAMKAKAEQLTGKKFKRGDWTSMISALTDLLEG